MKSLGGSGSFEAPSLPCFLPPFSLLLCAAFPLPEFSSASSMDMDLQRFDAESSCTMTMVLVR